MANGIVTAVRGRSGGSYGVVTAVRGRATSPDVGIVTMVRGVAINDAITVDAGAPATIEPFEVADLSMISTGIPTTWVWGQVSGPLVTIVGTGPDRQYVTPGDFFPLTLVFQATVTTATGATASATVTHSIRAHGGPFMYVGNVLTAVAINPPIL